MKTTTTATTLTITTSTNVVRLSTQDDRINAVDHHNVYCASPDAARSVAGDLRAWGIPAETFEALVMF